MQWMELNWIEYIIILFTALLLAQMIALPSPVVIHALIKLPKVIEHDYFDTIMNAS